MTEKQDEYKHNIGLAEEIKELEIVVVIPTYNNGKTLAAVIEEVYRYADDIIVINDGSTDDTATFWNNIRLSALLPIQ